MSEVIVVAFDDVLEAQEALLAVHRLEPHHLIDLEEPCVVVRRPNGRLCFQEMQDVCAPRGALAGGFWSLLLGHFVFPPPARAAAARFHYDGVSNEFQTEVGETLRPGTSAVFFLARSADREAALAEAAGFEGGKVISSDLAPQAEHVLREALGQRHGTEVIPGAGGDEGP